MRYLKILTVALIAFTVASCCSCRTAKTMRASLAGTEWQMVEINAEAFKSENNSYTIALSNDNKVSGRGDCNRISGSYEFETEGTLSFGPLATTRMACPDLQMEAKFISTLGSITSYEIDGDLLILFDKGEKKMVLKAKKAE